LSEVDVVVVVVVVGVSSDFRDYIQMNCVAEDVGERKIAGKAQKKKSQGKEAGCK